MLCCQCYAHSGKSVGKGWNLSTAGACPFDSVQGRLSRREFRVDRTLNALTASQFHSGSRPLDCSQSRMSRQRRFAHWPDVAFDRRTELVGVRPPKFANILRKTTNFGSGGTQRTVNSGQGTILLCRDRSHAMHFRLLPFPVEVFNGPKRKIAERDSP